MRKITWPMRAAADAGAAMVSLDSNDAAEVVPLEENVYVLESDMAEQPLVLLETVRDEDVFQRLALLRDFQVAVALAAFHLVIVVDEQPVERGMLAEDLLHQQEATVVVEPAIHAGHQGLAIQRPDELQGKDHERDRRVLDLQPIVEVTMRECVGPRKPGCDELLIGLAEHVLRGIQPDKTHVSFRRQHRANGKKGVRRRAAEVVDGAAVHSKVSRQFANHALNLGVERHRAVEHVVEDRSRIPAEGEVFVAHTCLGKQLVLVGHALNCSGSTSAKGDQLPCYEARSSAASSDSRTAVNTRCVRSVPPVAAVSATGALSGNHTSASSVTTPQLAKCTTSGSMTDQDGGEC